MKSLLRLMSVSLLWLTMVPAFAYGQGSIGGIVRDSSGAVLPGVTVEASSPSLIEKTRAVVTDGTGQYSIVNLRPGTYQVAFTLTGFTVVKRDGIELTGSFAATVNAELRVGSVAETVTVTGETPIVDVQSATKQRVIGQDVLDGIPTGRTHLTATTLIPGMNISNQDVGGTNIINTTGGVLTIHGGRIDDQRIMVDGISIANAEGTGYAANMLPDLGSTREVAVDYAAGTAEQGTGGVRINMIPKDGGNMLAGSLFGTAINSSFQGNNYTQELTDRGLRTPNTIKLQYDVNPGVGGPLRRDKLWFYSSARFARTANYVGNLFANLNAGNPNLWTYEPDLNQRAFADATERSANVRLTWQPTPRNKFSVFYDNHWRCQCSIVSSTETLEAAFKIEYPHDSFATVTWTSPLTNRILLEARAGFRRENYAYARTPAGDPALQLIDVREQGGLIPGLHYRGGGLSGNGTQPYQNTDGRLIPLTASMTYVTGSHTFKVGFLDTIALRDSTTGDNDYHLSYRFNNGIPNQLTERTTPFQRAERQRADLGIFAQDKWTHNRLTMNLGVRFDYFDSYFPEQSLGPAPLAPSRNITFPRTQMLDWKDVVPRLGASYDLFGNGRTALKTTLNKYVIAQGLQGAYGDSANPVNRLANFVTRSWTDANRNFYPDCDLLNPLANDRLAAGGDFCGVMSDTNFGKPTLSAAYDPALLSGWGTRPYNWEFSTSVQHEVMTRVSLDVGYFRRWYGNFGVTDNRALSASDFGQFSVTAPIDARLPGGGGYAIAPFFDLNPAAVGRAPDNYFTLAKNYGEQIEHWNGIDVSVNARPRAGVVLQGGVSTGRTLTDNCAVLATLPEVSVLGNPYCHQQRNLLTQLKFLGSYTVPRVDVQFSGSFQSIPGPQISANQVISNAVVRQSLGRDLSANAANVTVNLVAPGSLYGDRLNQLDLRFAKLFRSGSARYAVNLDLYNTFNAGAVLAENPTYSNTTASGWRVPTTIVTARFAKISVQIDF